MYKTILCVLCALFLLSACDERVSCSSDGKIYHSAASSDRSNLVLIPSDTQVCKINPDGSLLIYDKVGRATQ